MPALAFPHGGSRSARQGQHVVPRIDPGLGRRPLARLLDRRRALAARRGAALRHPRRPVATTTTRSSPSAASSAAASGTRWTASATASRRRRSTTRSPGSGPSWSGPASSACARSRRWPGSRPCRSPTCSPPSCATAGPGSPPPPWSRSTRCCSGTRRRRAATRSSPCSARSRPSTSSAPSTAASAATWSSGACSRPWRCATHYFAFFPIAVEALWLLWRRRGGRRLAGLGIVALAGLALAPLAHPPVVRRPRRMDRHPRPRPPDLGDGRDLPRRRDRRHHRPAREPAAGAGALPARARRPVPGRRCGGRGTSAAPPAIPLALAAAAVGDPAAAGDRLAQQGLRPRPQPDRRRVVPLLVAVAIGVTLRGARRVGIAVGAALFAYSLGFSVWASVSPALQRPDWERGRGDARRADRAAGDRHLDPGPGLAAPLPGDGLLPGLPVGRLSAGTSTRSTSSPTGPAPPVAAGHARPRLPPGRIRAGRPPLPAALRAARPRPDAAAVARACAAPTSTSAATASSSTGSGRAGKPRVTGRGSRSPTAILGSHPADPPEERHGQDNEGDPDRRPRRRPLFGSAREPLRAAPDRGRRPARQPSQRVRSRARRLRPRDRQRQGPGQGRDQRPQGPEGPARGRREPPRRLRAAAGAEEAQEEQARPPDPARRSSAP